MVCTSKLVLVHIGSNSNSSGEENFTVIMITFIPRKLCCVNLVCSGVSDKKYTSQIVCHNSSVLPLTVLCILDCAQIVH